MLSISLIVCSGYQKRLYSEIELEDLQGGMQQRGLTAVDLLST
jgi:hypothetical protein